MKLLPSKTEQKCGVILVVLEQGRRMARWRRPGGKVKRGKNWAFSLVEILVVVAILAVLAVLFFPTARGWMAQARMAKCLSNMRTIGQAAQAFGADNGRLPALDAPPTDAATALLFGSAGNDRLMMTVYPYVQKAEAFQCPAIMGDTTDPEYKSRRYVSTYNQNVYTFAARPGALPSASNMILIYEGYPFFSIAGTPPFHQVNGSPISSTMPHHPSKIPTKTQNVLMVDGSAQTGLFYIGWANPKNTIPADEGIWGGSRYEFNR